MYNKLAATTLVALIALMMASQPAEASVIGKVKFFVKAPFIVIHTYAVNILDGIHTANYYVRVELADAWDQSR